MPTTPVLTDRRSDEVGMVPGGSSTTVNSNNPLLCMPTIPVLTDRRSDELGLVPPVHAYDPGFDGSSL